MCFGCSKEPPHRDGSFEYPQHMFWLRNEKIIFRYPLLSGGLTYATSTKTKEYQSSLFSIPQYINLETSNIVFDFADRKRRGSLSYRSEGDTPRNGHVTPRNGHVTFLPPLISTSGAASDLDTTTQITNGKMQSGKPRYENRIKPRVYIRRITRSTIYEKAPFC